MSFIRTHVPSHNFQYEWRVNRANCLIILPNPDITNPEVVENLLYVGNRINEENNQMLRNMMQHLHLQGPPYGPQ